MKLKTIDIPQADKLTHVRRLIDVIGKSRSTAVKDLAERSGFSERHVRYRLQAARVLGLVEDGEQGPILTALRQVSAKNLAGERPRKDPTSGDGCKLGDSSASRPKPAD